MQLVCSIQHFHFEAIAHNAYVLVTLNVSQCNANVIPHLKEFSRTEAIHLLVIMVNLESKVFYHLQQIVIVCILLIHHFFTFFFFTTFYF